MLYTLKLARAVAASPIRSFKVAAATVDALGRLGASVDTEVIEVRDHAHDGARVIGVHVVTDPLTAANTATFLPGMADRLDQNDPVAGLHIRTRRGWFLLPRGGMVPMPGRAPGRPLAPSTVDDALRSSPTLQANAAAILTDERLRTVRYTAAAHAIRHRDRGIALLSAFAAFAAVLISGAFWIASGWPGSPRKVAETTTARSGSSEWR